MLSSDFNATLRESDESSPAFEAFADHILLAKINETIPGDKTYISLLIFRDGSSSVIYSPPGDKPRLLGRSFETSPEGIAAYLQLILHLHGSVQDDDLLYPKSIALAREPSPTETLQ